MNLLIKLRGNNKKLSIAELESLFIAYNLKYELSQIQENIVNINLNNSTNLIPLLSRTAFTKIAFKIIHTFPKETFLKELTSYNFTFKGSFFIRSSTRHITEKEIAEILWKKSQDKKVQAHNPAHLYYFHSTKNHILFTEKIYENKKEFLERMPKKRPVNSPFTLKSDLARALVNLLAIKNGAILDPFCGVGGLLLEAESLGLSPIGIDIKWKNLIGAKRNLSSYFHTKPTLIIGDSRKQFLKPSTIDGIVTDIPYGKSTSIVGNDLTEKFLENAEAYLKKNKRIVVVYSNYVNIEELFKKKFKTIYKIKEYINKSMTRYIIVGTKKNGL